MAAQATRPKVAAMLASVTRFDVMVRLVSSFIDLTGWKGTIPIAEVGYMYRKGGGEAKGTETRGSLDLR
jgi:hypothetical protein